MADESTAPLAGAIHDHLELKRQNSALEYEMPPANYMSAATPGLSSQHVSPCDEANTEELAMSAR
jgi:hypothetical protein